GERGSNVNVERSGLGSTSPTTRLWVRAVLVAPDTPLTTRKLPNGESDAGSIGSLKCITIAPLAGMPSEAEAGGSDGGGRKRTQHAGSTVRPETNGVSKKPAPVSVDASATGRSELTFRSNTSLPDSAAASVTCRNSPLIVSTSPTDGATAHGVPNEK